MARSSSDGPLFYSTVCDARLRRRPGSCRRPVKPPKTRCSVHSGGELSPEGRAIIATAAKARHAKQRAHVARGELSRFPQGRKRKHLIPRWWRFRLSEAEQTAVLQYMAAYDARVRGGEPRPPWQPSASTEMIAKDLESCERALVLAMNRPDPPPLETIEQVYANVREAETIVGDAGSEVRLKRLAWEIERFRRQRQQRRLESSSDPLEEPNPPGEVRASNPSTREPPTERRDEAPARPAPPPPPPPAPPDTFRDAVAPHDAVERELAAELARAMRQISGLPLAESARRSLDRELENAHGIAGARAAPASRHEVSPLFWADSREVRDAAAK